jgi:hypothetical protein
VNFNHASQWATWRWKAHSYVLRKRDTSTAIIESRTTPVTQQHVLAAMPGTVGRFLSHFVRKVWDFPFSEVRTLTAIQNEMSSVEMTISYVHNLFAKYSNRAHINVPDTLLFRTQTASTRWQELKGSQGKTLQNSVSIWAGLRTWYKGAYCRLYLDAGPVGVKFTQYLVCISKLNLSDNTSLKYTWLRVPIVFWTLSIVRIKY